MSEPPPNPNVSIAQQRRANGPKTNNATADNSASGIKWAERLSKPVGVQNDLQFQFDSEPAASDTLDPNLPTSPDSSYSFSETGEAR